MYGGIICFLKACLFPFLRFDDEITKKELIRCKEKQHFLGLLLLKKSAINLEKLRR